MDLQLLSTGDYQSEKKGQYKCCGSLVQRRERAISGEHLSNILVSEYHLNPANIYLSSSAFPHALFLSLLAQPEANNHRIATKYEHISGPRRAERTRM